jgi:formylglycine-generating enzyme
LLGLGGFGQLSSCFEVRPGSGSYRLNGNVMEWCADWYGPYTTVERENTDPQGTHIGDGRDLRGGSWARYYLRAAFRYRRPPTYSWNRIGFRVQFFLD